MRLAIATKHGFCAGLLFGSAIVATAVPVTFQVNMRVQTWLGRFNPSTDFVEGRGSFNVDAGGVWLNGFTLRQSPTDTNIYVGIYDITTIPPGTSVDHKYVINSATSGLVWEGNVGVGRADRAFMLASSDQSLPVVYFDNLTNNPGSGIEVTFKVNMGVQVARGAFDPTTGIVEVRGPFYHNWGGGLVMTKHPTDQNIYVAAFRITTLSPGSSVPYKYAINNGAAWDTGPDRTFVLPAFNQTLPVDYFNRVDSLGPLSVSLSTDIGGLILVTVSWTAGPGVRRRSPGGDERRHGRLLRLRLGVHHRPAIERIPRTQDRRTHAGTDRSAPQPAVALGTRWLGACASRLQPL